MVPLRFIRALYCVDGSLHPLQGTAATLRGCPATAAGSKAFPSQHPGLFHATGFAVHPYPQGQVTPNTATPNEPDYADLPKLPSLEATLDGAVAAYGSNTRFPIYDTEFGYQTNPPEKIARAISPTLAAYYMNWAEYISWSDPRVASWDQYLLTDPPPPSNFDTGLEFANGTPKDPMYDAFRIPLYLPHPSGKKGQPLEVWGGVRPARYVKSPQVAMIQFAPSSGAAFKTIQRVTVTDAYGYFDTQVTFPSSGVVRIAWSQPGVGLVIQPCRAGHDRLGRAGARRPAGATSSRRGLLSAAMHLVRRVGITMSVAAVTAGLALAPLPARAVAQTNQIAMFQDDARMLTVPGPTLQTLRQLGVGVVRVTLAWTRSRRRSDPRASTRSIPPPTRAGSWSIYDQIVRDAHADGIAVDFSLTGGAPPWATGAGSPRPGATASGSRRRPRSASSWRRSPPATAAATTRPSGRSSTAARATFRASASGSSGTSRTSGWTSRRRRSRDRRVPASRAGLPQPARRRLARPRAHRARAATRS